MKWEQSFQKDIKGKLTHAQKEFQLYRKTDHIIYLQQAGNKLFSVVENYLMLKYHTRVKSYQQLLLLVENNTYDISLLTQVVQLHYFFYNGELQMDRLTAEKIFILVYNKMRSRVKR